MRGLCRFAVLTVMVAGAGLFLAGCKKEPGKLAVQGAFAFATGETQTTGAMFATFFNQSDVEVTITGGRSDAAQAVELHSMSMEGDVMKMRQVSQYAIEPRGRLELGPHGEHIMLMGLKAPLEQGKNFTLELETSAGIIPVDVRVLPAGMVKKKPAEQPAQASEAAPADAPAEAAPPAEHHH